jgi:altronate hydrolase
MQGFLRKDGRKGIRNTIVVAYLVECGHHVAREIAMTFREQGVHLIGFPGCYENEYAQEMMERLCTHPNVGAALLVSLGCESFGRKKLHEKVACTSRPVETLVIQEQGGTRKTIQKGQKWVEETLQTLKDVPKVEMKISDLVIGTICGGSDATSGLTANPGIGVAFDHLVDDGAACIFEETAELIGCEAFLARRAATPALAQELVASVEKAREYYAVLGRGSFASGNAAGELSTQEEKSLGAYAKSGSRPISGLIKPGDIPPAGGLYLLDVVCDGDVRFGFPNIVDNAEIVELIACGCHLTLFATGRGSVVGSAISPVIKICGNPQTFERMADDMDINAGAILTGTTTLSDIGMDIYKEVLAVAEGEQTASEKMCHQEFILTYKHFEPIGPACLPV